MPARSRAAMAALARSGLGNAATTDPASAATRPPSHGSGTHEPSRRVTPGSAGVTETLPSVAARGDGFNSSPGQRNARSKSGKAEHHRVDTADRRASLVQ